MKRQTILFELLNFGEKEMYTLRKKGKFHEAYQFEAAKKTMIWKFFNSTIHDFKKFIMYDLTGFSEDCRGVKSYDNPLEFIFDDDVRKTVENFYNNLWNYRNW